MYLTVEGNIHAIKMQYTYSKKVFTGRIKSIWITGDPDNQRVCIIGPLQHLLKKKIAIIARKRSIVVTEVTCFTHWASVLWIFVGRDSLVDIATRYGLDGPKIESRWMGVFPHPALGPSKPPIQWVRSHSQGVKRPGLGVDHALPSSTEVKDKVELYFYYPSGTSWSILGWPLPFTNQFSQKNTHLVNLSNFDINGLQILNFGTHTRQRYQS
jgi:hypothetical protein